jgi:hypothetical protein
MSKIFLFNIDLISKEDFTNNSLEKIKERILELGEGNEISEVLSDVLQKTKDGRIEIYLEDTGISGDSGEEILSFVKLVESNIGGFISGSSFEVGKDQPGPVERWVRGEYSWDLEEKLDEGDSWEDDTYWEDEWNEWNEEWN